jgi:hypothetical protein
MDLLEKAEKPAAINGAARIPLAADGLHTPSLD